MLRRSALALAAPALATGCVSADRIVFDADLDLRRGTVQAEYREERLWHRAVDGCTDAAACVEKMARDHAETLSGITDGGGRGASGGYRVHDGAADRLLRFAADLDADVLRTDTSRVLPVTVSGRWGGPRKGLVVMAPPVDDGVVTTVVATGRPLQLSWPETEVLGGSDPDKVTTAWVFSRGRRAHVTLTVDTTGSAEAARADRAWVARTPGLVEALQAQGLLVE